MSSTAPIADSELSTAADERLNVAAADLPQKLALLHAQVVDGRRRIQLCRDGCDDLCIVISKEELDSLEGALDLLAQTEEIKAVSQLIERIARLCEPGAAAS